jgi:hypothetical protein
MKNKLAGLCLVITIACSNLCMADECAPTPAKVHLPPIETLLLQPVQLEHISLWVPAAKFGPETNRACEPRIGNSHSVALSSTVNHTKTESCPEELARVLAEYTAGYHQQSLPLTIVGTWRWEYFYSPCQYDSVSFDLRKRGGSYEGSWEAILAQSSGSIGFQWAHISDTENLTTRSDHDKIQSRIETQDFSAMRMRDGYPKERRFYR